MTLTPETLAVLRQRAEQGQVLFNPTEVLALLDRIAELGREKARALDSAEEAARLRRMGR